MNLQETIDHLNILPLPHALWWFIENVGEDHPHRTELFFHMRDRMRNYSPEKEHKYELRWEELMRQGSE